MTQKQQNEEKKIEIVGGQVELSTMLPDTDITIKITLTGRSKNMTSEEVIKGLAIEATNSLNSVIGEFC